MTDDLERRVAALERAVLNRSASPAGPAVGAVEPTDFWALDELRSRHPDGAVVFAGTAHVGKGEVAWQWGVASDRARESDWSAAVPALEALSHPVRLHLLQRVLNGTTTTAELALDDRLGTTGQLHHHLRALVAGGWLASTGRGHWDVPPPRVIPLLVVVAAAANR